LRQVDWPVPWGSSNLNPFFTPDIATSVLCREFYFNPPMQDISIGSHIFSQVAHIAPVASIRDIPIERVTFSQHHGEKFLAEVKLLVFLKVRENLRVQDVNACVDSVTENLTPARLLKELCDMAFLVGDNHPVLQRIM